MLFELVKPLPIGVWVRPVYRLSKIKARIANGNKVSVPIGNVFIGIGIHGVVRRIGL